MKPELCHHCGNPLVASVKMPIVSAASLGLGRVHYPCAVAIWNSKAEENDTKKLATALRRKERGYKLMEMRHGPFGDK